MMNVLEFSNQDLYYNDAVEYLKDSNTPLDVVNSYIENSVDSTTGIGKTNQQSLENLRVSQEGFRSVNKDETLIKKSEAGFVKYLPLILIGFVVWNILSARR